MVRRTGTNENDESLRRIKGIGRTTQLPMKLYWKRPTELEDLSLFNLHLTHKFDKGNWKKCTKENIVRIWPRPSPLRNGKQWEEFCRVKVLLHVPHRSIQEIKENDDLPWTRVYTQNIETINDEIGRAHV